MPRYRYQAAAGAELVKGEAEAASKSALVDRIHAEGRVPIRVEEVGTGKLASILSMEIGPRRRMSAPALTRLASQLATLLKAGVALDEALTLLHDMAESKKEREALRFIIERVSGGATLSEAMAAQQGFPELYVSMVRAGEAGASLEPVLERLSEFLERSLATREHLKSALLYPAIVVLACLSSLALIFLFVVPRFRPLFEQSGPALPTPARALMAASDFLQAYGWLCLIAAVAAAGFFGIRLRDPANRQRWDARLLRLPLIGVIARAAESARFCRTLGTLLKNGVTIVPALPIAQKTVRNRAFREALAPIFDQVKAGKGLAGPMRDTKMFPPAAVHLARVGEESGRQDDMLLKTADMLEAETRRSLDRMLSLLGPAVTVGLGVIVAAVILSILSALLSVYDLAI